MIVRELFAKLGLDVDEASFNAAGIALAGVKAGLVALASGVLAAGAGLVAIVSDMVETTGSLNDMAQATGVSTDALQELAYAAKLNGAGLDEVRVAVTILSKHLAAAAQGNEEASKTFAQLHIRIRGASGELRAADEVLGDVADRFAAMPDGPRKTALAMDLFGKSGAALIPTLNAGRKGLAELRQEARDLGIVLDKETIAAGDDLGDNLDRLKLAVKGVQYAIGGPLLGQVNELVQALLTWVKANRALIAQRIERVMMVVLAVVRGLATALNLLWKAIGFVIDNWRLFAVVLGSVVLYAIGANIAAILALVGQYILYGTVAAVQLARVALGWVAAAAGPAAIVALLAVGLLLVDEFITYLQGGETLIGALWPAWMQFLEDFINGGSDSDPWWLTALRGLAALVTHFPEIWNEMISELKGAFVAFGQWVSGLFDGIVNGITSRIRSTVGSVKSFFGFGGQAAPVFGGGASPAASVSASPAAGGARVLQQNNQPNLIFNVPAGTSPEGVGASVRAEWEAWNRTQLEEGAAALGYGAR